MAIKTECRNLVTLMCLSHRRCSNERVIIAAVVALLAIACTDVERGAAHAPVTVQLNQDTRATVSVRYGYSGVLIGDSTIERMFDGNSASWWTAKDAQCDIIKFELNLETSKYLTGIRLAIHDGIFPKAAGIALHYPGDDEKGGPNYFETQFGNSQPKIVNIPEHHYARLLKAGSVRIDIMGCTPKNGKLEISEMTFQFSGLPTFNPEFSASAVLQTVKGLAEYSSDGFWKFSGEGDGSERNKFKLRDKYLAHLMYYGLVGNQEAENLFLKYAPPGTASGEDISYMKSWYNKEKESRSKKQDNRGQAEASPISRTQI